MKKITTIATLVVLSLTCFGQVSNGLLTTLSAVAGQRDRMPIEKLYLQLDKPYYAIGDTLRFKAYLLNGDLLKPSTKSRIFYVELIDDSIRVAKRQVLMLRNGIAWGDIVCKKTWHAGNYTLRAYTNWMRNFSEEHFFRMQVGIVPAGSQEWLISNRVTVDKDKNVNMAMRFTDRTHRNIGFRDMQLSVLQGTNVLLKNKTRTGPEGTLDFKFALPEIPIATGTANGPLSLLAQDISKDGGGRKIVIPIRFNRPGNIDLQFMPEGGNMVAGIPTKIGFKAIGEDGKGTTLAGKIVNSKLEEVAAFKSTHKGMGAFVLTPQAGETYTAKVMLPGDSVKSYPLPVVNQAGIVLQITSKEKDSLEVTLSGTADIVNNSSAYYLIGQTRGLVCYSSIITFKANVVKKTIAKDLFPVGIAHFTLFNGACQPLNERIVYISHNDNLQIMVNTSKPVYTLRDNIGLNMQIKDKDGKPIRGLFSMAVTDDNQITTDSTANNILTSLLLTSDLKGTVEEPNWYFEKDNNVNNISDKAIALDNLLLTQGWIDYDWKQLLMPPIPPEYEAETEFKVKGRASDIFGLSIKKTDIMLISTQPHILMNTTTGKGGRFTFSGFPVLDTINFHIQPAKTFNIGLTIDEFYPPEYTPLKNPPMPWYINSDTTILSYINKKQTELDEAFDIGKSKLLKEVIIKGKVVEQPPPLPPILVMNNEELHYARMTRKPLNLIDMLLARKIKLRPWWNLYWLYQYNVEDIKDIMVTGNEDLRITTFSGKGVLSGTKGYSYHPLPISWPHKFYSPKYTVNTTVTGKDRRSTIFWEPNIVTDASGKSDLSFYSADQPGTYTVIIEGTDMNGNFGYSRQKIKIVPTATAAK